MTPDYFATLRLPLLSGRGFTDQDREETQQVAIVSRSFARRHWGDADPLGRRFRLGTGPSLTVIGVAGDHVHDWFGRRGAPSVFQPFAQAPTGEMVLALRGSVPAALWRGTSPRGFDGSCDRFARPIALPGARPAAAELITGAPASDNDPGPV